MTNDQKAIGGFFELELPSKGSMFHDQALALANGRVCFKVLLERVKPTKVFIPFYCCDSLILPLTEAAIPYEYYAINAAFDPVGIPLLGDSELFVYINYFGLKTQTSRKLSRLLEHQLVIDNTQAFFETTFGSSWSFNSVRKFFGVPDGGFLYSPQYLVDNYKPNEHIVTEHLWLGLFGKQEDAHEYFALSEAMQTLEVKGMSNLTKQILYAVKFPEVVRARRKYFKFIDRMLRPLNQLPFTLLNTLSEAVPYCYPFLPHKKIDKKAFYDEKVFLPSLWDDVLKRDTEGYAFEKMISNDLIALPVDHRLNEQDLQRMISIVNSHCVIGH
jgi:hypothetical protein